MLKGLIIDRKQLSEKSGTVSLIWGPFRQLILPEKWSLCSIFQFILKLQNSRFAFGNLSNLKLSKIDPICRRSIPTQLINNTYHSFHTFHPPSTPSSTSWVTSASRTFSTPHLARTINSSRCDICSRNGRPFRSKCFYSTLCTTLLIRRSISWTNDVLQVRWRVTFGKHAQYS